MVALIPAAIVAAVVGKQGVNTLLVASQVVLSLILPFVVFPLVYLTSSDQVMSVPGTSEKDGPTVVNFRNGRIIKTLGYLAFIVILAADLIAIGTLIHSGAPK